MFVNDNGDPLLTMNDQEFLEVYEKIGNCLLGKQIQQITGRHESQFTRWKQNGRGPIRDTCEVIWECKKQADFGRRQEAEAAIRAIVNIICSAGGFVAIRPLVGKGEIKAYLEQLRNLSQSFADLISEINKGLSEDSEDGRKISENEMRGIREKGKELVSAVYSLLLV